MDDICKFLDLVSLNEKFKELFGEPYLWRFIPNEIEGRAELASYLEDKTGGIDNLQRINFFYGDLEKESFNNLSELVYGSLGSSSSQIFVPRHIVIGDFSINLAEKCKIVNINIDSTEWSIILVPDNIVGGNYIPFEILQDIYLQFGLPIAISNSVSHTFYSKDKCFKDLEKSNKFSATLYELKKLKEGELSQLKNLKEDELDDKQKVLKNVLNALNNIVNENFLKKVVVIPRFSPDSIVKYAATPYNLTYDKTTIQNGWTSVLQLKPDIIRFTDIGGGKTNKYYQAQLPDVVGLIDSVLKERKTPAVGLTGKIRADLESYILLSKKTCPNIEKYDDIICDEQYKKYFDSINIPSYALLPQQGSPLEGLPSEGLPSEVSPQPLPSVPTQGGKKTRKLHKRNLKKRKSKKRKCKKTNRIVRRKRKRTKK